jgi:hypothetical protein
MIFLFRALVVYVKNYTFVGLQTQLNNYFPK